MGIRVQKVWEMSNSSSMVNSLPEDLGRDVELVRRKAKIGL